jgi:hypothetical protein
MVFLSGHGVSPCCYAATAGTAAADLTAAPNCSAAVSPAAPARAGKDDFDVLDPDPGHDLAKIAAGLVVFLHRRTRAEVAAACQDNGGLLAGERADIIRRHRHADPNDLVDIGRRRDWWLRFEQYRWQIVTIATALFVQMLLIVGLFIERHRRRYAEATSRQHISELLT